MSSSTLGVCLRAGGMALAAVACIGLAAGPARSDSVSVPIVYLGQIEPPHEPLSLLDPVLEDEGLIGARKGVEDNQTTGGFLGHDYELLELVVPQDADPAAAARETLAGGARLIVADLDAEPLLAVADLPEAADALIFNVRAPDDLLRTEECRANVFHIAPSRAMKADALAQFLVWKQWRRWFLVHGSEPRDQAFAAALRRAAERFGGRIVDERAYEFDPIARRTDTGHVQTQRQMPVVSQTTTDYDVLVVADESDIFGEYLPYNTWQARPVAGTQGLIPTAWHRSHEQWGGTQLQRRFESFAGRPMTERDHNAWLALRSIGEAVTRTESGEAKVLHDYLVGQDFSIAAFKGEGLTFRSWDQQMRQPILLAGPRALVSVSPQEGFLHQRTHLDTLGHDEPDTPCRLN